jgi:hypothetical protein
MHMVGHDHEGVHHNIVAHPFGTVPFLRHDAAARVQRHATVNHLAK